MLSIKSLIILFSIFSFAILSPALSEAVDSIPEYDFGNVKVGSIQTAAVTISTATDVELTGIKFNIQNTCNDMTLLPVAIEFPYTLSSGEIITVEVAYSPSESGECSGTLEIYSVSPFDPPDEVFFTGIGVEQEPEHPAPDNISQLLLEKLQKIIDYTNEIYTYQAFRSYEQDRLSKGRMKAFKTKLTVSYHLIEKGQFEAAHKKLKEISKKTDGKPESNDFVPPEKAANLALMLQDIIASFDFEDKQAKQSKKSL
jgi:hypothetical protein